MTLCAALQMASSYKRVTWKESSKNPFGSYIKYKSNAYALCMSQCRKIKKGSSKNIAKPNQTQISLVWKGLNSKQWINSQTQNFSDIAIWGYFLKSSKIPLWWCSLNAFVIIIVFVFVFLILLVMVMFSHDPIQFCEAWVWSGRPEGFESRTVNMQYSQWPR